MATLFNDFWDDDEYQNDIGSPLQQDVPFESPVHAAESHNSKKFGESSSFTQDYVNPESGTNAFERNSEASDNGLLPDPDLQAPEVNAERRRSLQPKLTLNTFYQQNPNDALGWPRKDALFDLFMRLKRTKHEECVYLSNEEARKEVVRKKEYEMNEKKLEHTQDAAILEQFKQYLQARKIRDLHHDFKVLMNMMAGFLQETYPHNDSLSRFCQRLDKISGRTDYCLEYRSYLVNRYKRGDQDFSGLDENAGDVSEFRRQDDEFERSNQWGEVSDFFDNSPQYTNIHSRNPGFDEKSDSSREDYSLYRDFYDDENSDYEAVGEGGNFVKAKAPQNLKASRRTEFSGKPASATTSKVAISHEPDEGCPAVATANYKNYEEEPEIAASELESLETARKIARERLRQQILFIALSSYTTLFSCVVMMVFCFCVSLWTAQRSRITHGLRLFYRVLIRREL